LEASLRQALDSVNVLALLLLSSVSFRYWFMGCYE